MKPREAVLWRQVIDELANALQRAIGHSADVIRNARTTAADAERLQASIARAVTALDRVRPPGKGGRR